MTLKLPASVQNATMPAVDERDTWMANLVAELDAWVKSLCPAMSVTYDGERTAPPRRISGPHRGESIEQARARNPGPPRLTVRGVDARTKLPTYRPVPLVGGGTLNPATRGEVLAKARIEILALQEKNKDTLNAHVLSDAVLLSGVPESVVKSGTPEAIELCRRASWDYPESTAKRFDLMGTLCPESVADEGFTEREARIHELRGIIAQDWHSSLLKAVESVLQASTSAGNSAGGMRVAVKQAVERARAKSI